MTKDLPTFPEMEKALLVHLAKHGPQRPRDVYGPLADQFGLSTGQRSAPLQDLRSTRWSNRVQWTRQRLKNKGYLSSALRVWDLSAAGLRAARDTRPTRSSA